MAQPRRGQPGRLLEMGEVSPRSLRTLAVVLVSERERSSAMDALWAG